MCDCAEEKERRAALERKRRVEGYSSSQSESSVYPGDGGVRWYSILFGTALLALTALAVKTGADKEGWARPIYLYLGLVEEKPPGPCALKINESKRRWPLEEKTYE